MKRRTRAALSLCAALAGLAAWAASGQAQTPGLAMLDQIPAGRWDLRMRGTASVAQSLCVNNGRRLIQLRHPGETCESYVVDDRPNDVTVQYTCHGRGYGRTRIHRESSQILQIESQGIADGFPFDFVAEARRTGNCTP